MFLPAVCVSRTLFKSVRHIKTTVAQTTWEMFYSVNVLFGQCVLHHRPHTNSDRQQCVCSSFCPRCVGRGIFKSARRPKQNVQNRAHAELMDGWMDGCIDDFSSETKRGILRHNTRCTKKKLPGACKRIFYFISAGKMLRKACVTLELHPACEMQTRLFGMLREILFRLRRPGGFAGDGHVGCRWGHDGRKPGAEI